jgi:putative heme iron utilization protein
MAMHAQNLAADARASLLVTQSQAGSDPLALGRATLLGSVARVGDAEIDSVAEDYLRRHANARQWVSFDDFAFYRLEVRDLYYVGGFGAMGWVDVADYRAAVRATNCA